ncbi:MAG: cytochrome b/b6 domain-containing protein [Alphaproteobacteria bacterium]|nr:cytochrome b/b6 domain-containing protein [Alphaproteobacteria bacterium]
MSDDPSPRWTISQRIIHWLTALCVLIAAGIALYLLNPPDWSEPYVRRYYAGIAYHKLLGVTGLALVLLLAALGKRGRRRPGGPIMRFAAAGVQVCLILFTALSAFSGYIANSFFGGALWLPGLGSLPSPLPYNESLGGLFTSAHQWLAYGVLFLIALHVVAALTHLFVLRDDVFSAMVTGGRREE